VANAVATVDQMSGGRVILGIGAGWYEREHKAFGIPFPLIGERFDRLDEQMQIIKGLWTTPQGEPFSSDGRFWQLEEARNFAVLVQKPRPEIVIGGLAVITVSVLEAQTTVDAVGLIGKAGRVVVTSVSHADDKSISLTGSPMVGFHKRIQGSLAGGSNPIFEMTNLLGLYKSGHLKLDEIMTRRYSLEQVNEGYHDLLAGKNIRGVIIHES